MEEVINHGLCLAQMVTPPGSDHISLTINGTFEDDDFPAFPFGGLRTRSLEGKLWDKFGSR